MNTARNQRKGKQGELRSQNITGSAQNFARLRGSFTCLKPGQRGLGSFRYAGGVSTRKTPDVFGSGKTSEPRQSPPLPRTIADPRPVLAIGSALWVGGAVATYATAGVNHTVQVCIVGVIVGVLGYLVYSLQRLAVVRGSTSAQTGIYLDSPPEHSTSSPQ